MRRARLLAAAGIVAGVLGGSVVGCGRTLPLSYQAPSNEHAVSEPGSGGGSGGGTPNGGATGHVGEAGAGGDQGAGAAGSPEQGFGDVCDRTSNHVQGSRLRARTVVTEEGDRAWLGWHDSLLGLDCTFYGTEGGVSRCLPDGRAFARLLYVDGECSKPLLVVTGSPSNVSEVRVLEAHGCTRTYAHYRLGPEVDAADVLYEVDILSGRCSALASRARTFSVGDEMDLTEYVRGELRQVTTQRLATDAIVASDGTYQVAGERDTLNDISCVFLPGTDGVERCWPAAAVYQERYYSDASCSDELLRGHECSSQAGLARVSGLGQCPSAARVIAHGEPYRGRIYGEADSGECVADSQGDLPPLFEPEREVAATTFEATSLTTLESDPGRLKPRYRTTQDGFCSFEDWWDSGLSEPCRFIRLSDGPYRCVPGEISRRVSRYFRDAGCTEETRMAEAPPCPEHSDYSYLVVDNGLGRAGEREVYRVVRGTRPSSLWKQAEDGTCASTSGQELAGLVQVEMPIAADRFVAGTVIIE